MESSAIVHRLSGISGGKHNGRSACCVETSCRGSPPDYADRCGIQAAVRAHMAVAAYADPAFPEQSYAGAWMVIEGFEEVDDEFLERIFQRCHGQPWEIARTKRCVIRELSLEDLPALEKLYQKEGVTWRLDADGERIPGFIEPLFAKEKKKKNISRHILPICTDTMDMGCGWFLIKLPGN